MNSINVYVEHGTKRVFVGAVEWPGWCRSGRDEQAALHALLDYGSRYAQVLSAEGLAFQVPTDTSDLTVTERHEGNATTDFGVPAVILDADRAPMDQTELERLYTILLACWQAFDTAVQQATGRALRKGPRGGGRDIERIVDHVVGAEQGYLARIAWKYQKEDNTNPVEELRRTREAIRTALETAVHDGLPERGPRGGIIWPPRYFIRRVAWHVLDHAWEIEDRVT